MAETLLACKVCKWYLEKKCNGMTNKDNRQLCAYYFKDEYLQEIFDFYYGRDASEKEAATRL